MFLGVFCQLGNMVMDLRCLTTEVGHPRKYYTITSLGATLLSAMIEEYDRSQAVRTGISGGGKAE